MNLWSGYLFADAWLAFELGLVALAIIGMFAAVFFD